MPTKQIRNLLVGGSKKSEKINEVTYLKFFFKMGLYMSQ